MTDRQHSANTDALNDMLARLRDTYPPEHLRDAPDAKDLHELEQDYGMPCTCKRKDHRNG